MIHQKTKNNENKMEEKLETICDACLVLDKSSYSIRDLNRIISRNRYTIINYDAINDFQFTSCDIKSIKYEE